VLGVPQVGGRVPAEITPCGVWATAATASTLRSRLVTVMLRKSMTWACQNPSDRGAVVRCFDGYRGSDWRWRWRRLPTARKVVELRADGG